MIRKTDLLKEAHEKHTELLLPNRAQTATIRGPNRKRSLSPSQIKHIKPQQRKEGRLGNEHDLPDVYEANLMVKHSCFMFPVIDLKP